MRKTCASCGRSLDPRLPRNHTWNEASLSLLCVNCSRLDISKTARCNNSLKARFERDDLNNPFASGSFRWVAKGKYLTGERSGQLCVCKWFKTSGGEVEKDFFEADVAVSKQTIRLITKWNTAGLIDKMVQVNLPEIWRFRPDGKSHWSNRLVLQEPYIANYQKFNSNTGWCDESSHWHRVMQALSHFSYHVSKGKLLLCDLQGGVYRNGIVLTDPVVMCVDRCFGPTDLGIDGINTFFAHHHCNEFCRSSWRKPGSRKETIKTLLPKMASTAMMPNVPTRHSRPAMTGL